MPVLIPTRAESAHLPWHARQRVRTAALRALREWAADTPEPEPPEPVVDHGRQIRDEARYLLSITPPDPDAAKHRAELVAAFGLSHRTAS